METVRIDIKIPDGFAPAEYLQVSADALEDHGMVDISQSLRDAADMMTIKSPSYIWSNRGGWEGRTDKYHLFTVSMQQGFFARYTQERKTVITTSICGHVFGRFGQGHQIWESRTDSPEDPCKKCKAWAEKYIAEETNG